MEYINKITLNKPLFFLKMKILRTDNSDKILRTITIERYRTDSFIPYNFFKKISTII